MATARDRTSASRRLREEVFWQLTAGAAAKPQHRKLYRMGEKLWHQLRTGYGPLGYVFGSAGSPRPIPFGYKCPACGTQGMSLLHVLTWCTHDATAEEAAQLGLRFVLRDPAKTAEQRVKAARWVVRTYPARVLRLLCRSGWISTRENLLFRPGAADPMSAGEVACLESEAAERAEAEMGEDLEREALAELLRRGVLDVLRRQRAAGTRPRVAVLPSLPQTAFRSRSAAPRQQETRAAYELRRDAELAESRALAAENGRRLEEWREKKRQASRQLLREWCPGACQLTKEWEAGAYDLFTEFEATRPEDELSESADSECGTWSEDFFPE